MRIQLAPSILTADFGRMADEVRSVGPHVDWFHLDVMDGHYVPNITFGASTVEAIRAAVDHPLHVHLMISDPVSFAPVFAAAGASRISFHPEVTDDPAEAIRAIVGAGSRPGIAVHPDVEVGVIEPFLEDIDVVLMMTVRPGFGGQSFMGEVVPKIAEARELVRSSGSGAQIEVDGGVNLDTVEATVAAGAEIVVAGSAIFDGIDAPAAARRMRERLDALGGDDGGT